MKTIFIDFGNVIGFFDHWKSVARLEHFSQVQGQALYDILYDNDLEDAYERGDLTTADYISMAIEQAGMTCTPEQFISGFKDIFTPNPKVCDAIPHLARRCRIVLASNTNDGHFTHYCEQFKDVLSHFAARPTSHQARARKPEAEFFAYCQRFADAQPGECVFIDDIAKNIAAGERHGWRGLLYRPGNLATGLRAQGVEL